MIIQKYDTIIVGGGIAGLTSAAYLARAGQRILLIEKNGEFGGLVNSFVKDGFHFEAGVRALESAGIILPMLHDLGIELDIVRSKVSIGIEDKILNIEDLKSIQDYRDLLVNLYPKSEKEIDHFIKTMRKIMKMLNVLYGIENPLFKDIKRDPKYLFKTLLPWLPKFLLTIGRINRLNAPFETYLEKIIKDPSLRDIISQHFFKNTPTFFALSYFTLYLDYFYPKGGVYKLIDGLVDKIKEFQGELLPNTVIHEINAENQYVVDDKNQKYYYNNLIWAADLKTLYKNTELGNLSAKIKESFSKSAQKIMQNKGGESVFSLFLEVDLPLSYFEKIAHGHFFYTNSKQGLGDIHRGELKNMIQHWENQEKTTVFDWLARYLKFNTYEISIPGLKDSTLVPENKTGFIISFIIDYELFKKVEESGWGVEFKEKIETTIIDILSENAYPALKENVEKRFSFSPIDIKKRILSSDGAIVGWSFEGKIPVIHKIQRSDKSVCTPLPNIFQAGQWAYSPAGVPMAILTGKLASDRVIKSK